MKYKIALIVGRFQPLHFGHLFLIKKALEKAEKIIFVIGSASIYDENNPLSFEQRKKMIEKLIKKEKISDRVLKIIPLEDFFDDSKWLKNLEKQVGKFDLVIGNNQWTNEILEAAGYKILRVGHYKRFLYEGWRIRKLIREGKSWQNRVPNYLISNIKDQSASWRTKIQIKNQKYKHVVLGGTFDRFHLGHRAIINKAFSIGKKVTIGLATERLYRKKFLSKIIESYPKRKKALKEYVKNHLEDGRLKVNKISDIYGPLKTARNIEAIVVSKRTYPNALKINQLREKNKLPLLKIITINNVLAEDGKLISSERIRAGEITREGKIYSNYFKKKLILPEHLREELRKPLEKVFKDTEDLLHYINIMEWTMKIAVGDAIIDSLLKSKIDPDVKVIDFKVRRKEFSIYNLQFPLKSKLLNFKKYKNKPGTINFKTAEKLKSLIHQPFGHPKGGQPQSWLIVDGEEDLLALPAILFAPLNSLVLYGHWQYGVIAVEVTEEMKEKIVSLVKKFD